MTTTVIGEAKEDLSVRLKNGSKFIPHALLGALLMFTLDHLGWLDGLERATIEMAAATSSIMPRVSVRQPQESAARYEDTAPRTLLIDEAAFQNEFRERTPLDRERLGATIEAVVARKPAILAIDIDLSPLAGTSDAERAAQERLDELLIRTSASTPVILVTPFATALPERARVNAQWMRKLCTSGAKLSFAHSYVARNQGVVTKIHPAFPSLGNAVYAQWTRRDTVDKGACAALSGSGGNDGYPAFLDAMFVHSLTAPLRERSALVPLNVNFFEEGLSGRLSYLLSDHPVSAPMPDDLAGHVVFLGTDIRTMDSLVTASGPQPGVLVHAATFFSRVHPIHALPQWLLFLIETLAGLMLLRAFTWLWQRYHADLDLPPSNRSLLRQAGAILLASRWSAAVIALTVLVSLFSIALSGFLLAQATWFNFAPIAIAAAVKAKDSAAETGRRALEDKLAELEHRHTRRVRSRVRRGLAVLLKHPWVAVLAVIALVLAIVH